MRVISQDLQPVKTDPASNFEFLGQVVLGEVKGAQVRDRIKAAELLLAYDLGRPIERMRIKAQSQPQIPVMILPSGTVINVLAFAQWQMTQSKPEILPPSNKENAEKTLAVVSDTPPTPPEPSYSTRIIAESQAELARPNGPGAATRRSGRTYYRGSYKRHLPISVEDALRAKIKAVVKTL